MDMESLMAQAQDLQTRISAAQDSLAKMHVKGVAENGVVIVDMTGKYDIISVVIAPNALSLGAETLSNLVAIAYKDAKSKADALIDKVMSEVTGQLNG